MMINDTKSPVINMAICHVFNSTISDVIKDVIKDMISDASSDAVSHMVSSANSDAIIDVIDSAVKIAKQRIATSLELKNNALERCPFRWAATTRSQPSI